MPSMIMQFNISIPTFFGRIISPYLEKSFKTFNSVFSHIEPNLISNNFKVSIYDRIDKFVENIPSEPTEENDEDENKEASKSAKFANKNDAKQQLYYIFMYLTRQICRSGFTLDQLMNPSTLNEYVTSRTYFNSILELMENIHQDSREYNILAYDYLINQKDVFDHPIRIIENYNDPSYRIVSIPGDKLKDYLQEHKLGLTLTGALFKVHDEELSVFYKFLKDLYQLRKSYKEKRDTFDENSFDYGEFNRRQLAVKVIK